MRLPIGTIVTGAHIDARLRRPRLGGRGAVGIHFVGIKDGRIVGLQIDQGQIEGGAGRMAGMSGDIAEPEQIGLRERRIKAPPGRRLLAVLRPGPHVRDSARGPVAIQHFQRQILPRKFLLDRFQL